MNRAAIRQVPAHSRQRRSCATAVMRRASASSLRSFSAQIPLNQAWKRRAERFVLACNRRPWSTARSVVSSTMTLTGPRTPQQSSHSVGLGIAVGDRDVEHRVQHAAHGGQHESDAARTRRQQVLVGGLQRDPLRLREARALDEIHDRRRASLRKRSQALRVAARSCPRASRMCGEIGRRNAAA